MSREIGEANRTRISDHEPENPVAARRGTNPRPKLVGDPICGETLKYTAIGSEHADRSIMSAHHFGGHLHHALEHPVERQLGDERGGGDDQSLETGVCADGSADCLSVFAILLGS